MCLVVSVTVVVCVCRLGGWGVGRGVFREGVFDPVCLFIIIHLNAFDVVLMLFLHVVF